MDDYTITRLDNQASTRLSLVWEYLNTDLTSEVAAQITASGPNHGILPGQMHRLRKAFTA